MLRINKRLFLFFNMIIMGIKLQRLYQFLQIKVGSFLPFQREHVSQAFVKHDQIFSQFQHVFSSKYDAPLLEYDASL